MFNFKKFWFKNKINEKKELIKECNNNIMELEIKVELYNIDFEIIEELLNQYIKLIEYYTSIESDNYIFYKNKMKQLLIKPKIVKILKLKNKEIFYKTDKNNNIEESIKTDNLKKSIKFNEFKNKLKNEENKNNIEVINNIQQNLNKTNEILKSDLNNQKLKLFEKLKKRKLNISKQKSLSKGMLNLNKESFFDNKILNTTDSYTMNKKVLEEVN